MATRLLEFGEKGDSGLVLYLECDLATSSSLWHDVT